MKYICTWYRQLGLISHAGNSSSLEAYHTQTSSSKENARSACTKTGFPHSTNIVERKFTRNVLFFLIFIKSVFTGKKSYSYSLNDTNPRDAIRDKIWPISIDAVSRIIT